MIICDFRKQLQIVTTLNFNKIDVFIYYIQPYSFLKMLFINLLISLNSKVVSFKWTGIKYKTQQKLKNKNIFNPKKIKNKKSRHWYGQLK